MSNINYVSINEDFPRPGEDNDTQVFRDNFSTIKINFERAKTEIGDLQADSAKISDDNDFNLHTIENAALKNIREHFYVVVQGDDDFYITADYESGAYQVIKVKSNANLNLAGFPDSTNLQKNFVGKMMLELYSDDDTEKTITISHSIEANTVDIKTNNSSFWDWDIVNNVDTEGVPLKNYVRFTVASSTDPVFIEVWRHGNTLFLNYLDREINLIALSEDISTIEGYNADTRLTLLENYTPAVDEHWSEPGPTTTAEALDRLAAAINAVNGNLPI